MMINRLPKSLDVYLSDTRVGSITIGANDKTFFEFDAAYRLNEARPVLSLFFRTSSGGLATHIQSSRTKVHPVFSNLLPEGHLRDYLSQKLGINEDREPYLLAALGLDLPGAVIVRVAANSDVAEIFEDHVGADKLKLDPGILKFSLAGVQLKFSAVTQATGGLTIPANGLNGTYIVKLPSNRFDSVPEAEHATLQFAKRFGIDVVESELVDTQTIANLPTDISVLAGQSLVVKRFDRQNQKRIHIEDFAQVFGLFPDDKYNKAAYSDIANVIWQTSGEPGLREFLHRLIFSIGTGNGDMHLKNWSLIYPDGINPLLSPAYDLVPTIAFSRDNTLALSVGGEKQMSKIHFENFERFAAKARLPLRLVQSLVSESVDKFHSAWIESRDIISFPPFVRNAINTHIQGLPLFKSKGPRR
jgi:serine/threonine-protein kinase HipA